MVTIKYQVVELMTEKVLMLDLNEKLAKKLVLS
mgnify:CR=1